MKVLSKKAVWTRRLILFLFISLLFVSTLQESSSAAVNMNLSDARYVCLDAGYVDLGINGNVVYTWSIASGSDVVSISYGNNRYCDVRTLKPGTARVSCWITRSFDRFIANYGYTREVEEFSGGVWDINVLGNEINVSFDANPGTVSTESKTVRQGSAYGTLPVPVYPEYDFMGWYLGSTKITSSTNVAENATDHTLTAHWKEHIYTNGISLSTTTATLHVGDSVTIKPTVTPADASNKTVLWASEDEGVATVSSSGKITATGKGSTNIIATTKEGGYHASVAVTTEYQLVKVDSSTPSDEKTGVALDSAITINCNVNVFAGVNYGDIKLRDAEYKNIECIKSISGNVLTIKPVQMLDSYTVYTLTVPENALRSENYTGNENPYQISFTTVNKAPYRPTISVTSSKVTPSDAIELSCSTSGAKIYYTTSGESPLTHGKLYTEKFYLSQGDCAKVRAVAVLDGNVSGEVSKEFTIERSEHLIKHSKPLKDLIEMKKPISDGYICVEREYSEKTDDGDTVSATDAYLARYDTASNQIWRVKFDDSISNDIYQLVVTDQVIAVEGSSDNRAEIIKTYNYNGELLYSVGSYSKYNGDAYPDYYERIGSCALSPEGILVGRYYDYFVSYSTKAVLTMYDLYGKFLWSKTETHSTGSNSFRKPFYSMAAVDDGFVVELYNGTYRRRKYSFDGTQEWYDKSYDYNLGPIKGGFIAFKEGTLFTYNNDGDIMSWESCSSGLDMDTKIYVVEDGLILSNGGNSKAYGYYGDPVYYVDYSVDNISTGFAVNGNYTIPDTIPQKEDAVFKGWTEHKNVQYAQYQPGEEITVSKNITLYPVWEDHMDTDIFRISGTSEYVENGTISQSVYIVPSKDIYAGIVRVRYPSTLNYTGGKSVFNNVSIEEICEEDYSYLTISADFSYENPVHKANELCVLAELEFEVLPDTYKPKFEVDLEESYLLDTNYQSIDLAGYIPHTLKQGYVQIQEILIPGYSEISVPTKYELKTFPSIGTRTNLAKWSMPDSGIASVDENGLVTPISNGTVELTAEVYDYIAHKTHTVTKKITVSGMKAYVTSLKSDTGRYDRVYAPEDLNRTIYLPEGTSRVKLTAAYPVGTLKADVGAIYNNVPKTINFQSLPHTVEITYSKEGYDDSVYSITFEENSEEAAKKPVTDLTLDKIALNMKPEEQLTLNASVSPEDASDQTIEWVSSDPLIASVDENGNVTAHASGKVEIMVYSPDSKITRSCMVYVTDGSIPADADVTWEIDSTGILNFYGDGLTIYGDIYKSNISMWNYHKDQIYEIYINDGIKAMHNGAFESYSNLRKVSIAGSVKEIESSVFSTCKNLSYVTIKSGVESIEHFAFENCEKLERVDLPLSISFIDSFVFLLSPLKEVYYEGSREDWANIEMEEAWNEELMAATIIYAKGDTISVNTTGISDLWYMEINTASLNDAKIFAAVYTSDHRLYSMDSADSNGGVVEVALPYTEDSYARVFAWNADGSLSPICDSGKAEQTVN